MSALFQGGLFRRRRSVEAPGSMELSGDRAALETVLQREIAEKRREIAEKQREFAEMQREFAETQRKVAETQPAVAELMHPRSRPAPFVQFVLDHLDEFRVTEAVTEPLTKNFSVEWYPPKRKVTIADSEEVSEALSLATNGAIQLRVRKGGASPPREKEQTLRNKIALVRALE